mgnify:FL=1
MIKLNLETKNKEQEILKAYLEENASETLADKINNGVKIQKDNKTLINKKTLDTFMKYAYEEARKLVEKGANCAYIEDKTVFAWAMHYFEEDTIEGILYNEDGSEYKKAPTTPPKQIEPQKPKKENNQQSFFDMIDLSTNTQENEDKIEEKEEIVEEVKQELPDWYLKYVDTQESYPDSLVFIKLGDFYEAFSETANIISKEMDLLLTKRDFGSIKVDLAGFPYHVKEEYITKVKDKYNCIVIENNNVEFIQKEEQKQEKNETISVDIHNQTFDKFLLKTISALLDGKVKLQ